MPGPCHCGGNVRRQRLIAAARHRLAAVETFVGDVLGSDGASRDVQLRHFANWLKADAACRAAVAKALGIAPGNLGRWPGTGAPQRAASRVACAAPSGVA